MAVVDAQILLALAWMETLLELEQLPASSGEHFLDLAQVDLLPREWWSVTHWTAEKWEHTPQQGPGPIMSFVGERGYNEPHDEASRPHMISHPVNFAQFLSAILACPA